MCPGAVMNVLVRLGTNQGRDWGYMNLLVRTATDFKTVAFVHSAIPPLRTDAGVEAAGPQIYCTH